MSRPEKQDLNKDCPGIPGIGKMSMPEKVCYNTALDMYADWLSSDEVREGIAKIIWTEICGGCDCENYPECPPDYDDGCAADNIAAAVVKLLGGEK